MSDSGTETAQVFKRLAEGTLSKPRKPLAPTTDSRLNQQHSEAESDLPTLSSINPNDENLMMSTRHNIDDDSHFLPKLRSTAQKYGYYNPPEPQPNIPTSAVNRAFHDFDQDNSSNDEDDSIEVARGFPRGARGTPSKLGGSDILLQLNDSMLNSTPPARPRPTTRKSDGVERGSLRRETTLRRASMMAQQTSNRTSPNKPANMGRRISSFADAYAKATAQDDGSFLASQRPDQRPVASAPFSAKNTRFRQVSAGTNPADLTGYGRASSEPPPDVSQHGFGTPKRSALLGTPRSAKNATVDNFALPDLSDLTELLGGTGHSAFQPQSAKPATRRANAVPRRSASNYAAIEHVPVPEDERQVMQSLQRLQEKVAELENQKEESDRQAELYEDQIAQLHAKLDARGQSRRADSGLGASEDESGAVSQAKWRVEQLKLQASIKTLQTHVEKAENKALNAQTSLKRVIGERDNVLTQLRMTAQNAHELEEECAALTEENQLLQEQISGLEAENHQLRVENEDLKTQLDNTQDRHDDDTQRWQLKEAELNKNVGRKDNRLAVQNQELRDQVDQLQNQLESHAKPSSQDQIHLAAEKARLTQELKDAKNARNQEKRTWQAKEKVLNEQIAQKDDTIRGLRQPPRRKQTASASASVNPATVAELQAELDRVMAQHDEDSQRWMAKEADLREQVERATLRGVVAASAPAKSSSASRLARVDHGSGSRSRSRSKSASRQRSAFAGNTADEPIEVSDQESTTDLNLMSTRPRQVLKTNGRSHDVRPAINTAHDDDLNVTQLSTVAEDLIADLRRRLELERLAKRRSGKQRRSTSAAEPIQTSSKPDFTQNSIRRSVTAGQKHATVEDDVESEISEHEIPAPSVISDDELTSDRNHNARPAVTSTLRRRRSSNGEAFEEMTSAFIVNDITIDAANNTHRRRRSSAASAAILPTGGLYEHNPKTCALCKTTANPLNDHTMNLPALVPLSQRPELQQDPDSTVRPVHHPLLAINIVVHALRNELAHYHIMLQKAQDDLQSLDPALAKRTHAALHDKIAKLNDLIKQKGAQIYELFDVLEGLDGAKKALKKRVGFEELTGQSEEWQGFAGEDDD